MTVSADVAIRPSYSCSGEPSGTIGISGDDLTPLAQLMEIESEFQSALIALRGIFCHGTGDDSIQLRRKFGIERGRAQRVAVGYLEAHCSGAVALKGPVAGDHAIENRT